MRRAQDVLADRLKTLNESIDEYLEAIRNDVLVDDFELLEFLRAVQRNNQRVLDMVESGIMPCGE